MVSLRDTLKSAHEALAEAGVSHALIGGFALASHGVHRTTVDIDLIADGDRRSEIIASLLAAGFTLEFETDEVLHFVGHGLLDVLLANRPLSLAMLKNAKQVGPLGLAVLDAEDIIALKIQAYTNDPKRTLRDQADIQSLIESKRPSTMTWDEYFDFLDEYWEIFGEPESSRAHVEYARVLL